MTRTPPRAATWIGVALALGAPHAARAHHGSASVGFIGTQGPGSALETTTPLPLGRGTVLALARTEYVPFQQRAGFEDPKLYSWFSTLAAGYGITPWLSAFVFQPYAVKAQEGTGTNHGLGDTNLMLALALKWDGGLQLVPEKESLDDLLDWHFGAWASCTVPVGPTEHRDGQGSYYAPDMQTGFRAPSPALGVTVLKQLSPDLTVLGEASYQHFFDASYPGPGIRYQFGGEARLSAALPWRAYAAERARVDLVPEVSILNLQRDREDGAALRASGGTILYATLGARWAIGPLSVGTSVKRAIATALNEASEQQGSEGLEVFRAALVVGWTTRI